MAPAATSASLVLESRLAWREREQKDPLKATPSYEDSSYH